jgi:nucleoside 2-deoxyribosyltransferase
MDQTMRKLYLAGPEVFASDAVEIGHAKRAICARYGFEGLFPLDNQIAAQASPRETGLAIFRANRDMIRSADLVIANLTPFRGLSADPGTVWEIGFAAGLGIPVIGYSHDPRPLLERAQAWGPVAWHADSGEWLDEQGLVVEAFGMADNLMIDGALAEPACALILGQAGTSSDLAIFERAVEWAARQER